MATKGGGKRPRAEANQEVLRTKSPAEFFADNQAIAGKLWWALSGDLGCCC